MNSRLRSVYVIVRPSVVCRLFVCNLCAPYSGVWNLRQYFYAIWYFGHPLTSR